MSTKQVTPKKQNLKNHRFDIHGYDKILKRIWNQIENELPQYNNLYQKYQNVLIVQGKSKAAKINNMRCLLSLGRILSQKGYDWKSITQEQVDNIQAYVMTRWADPDGKETWHTADHKKFLMIFVRWLKTGRREYNRKLAEPQEIANISISKVSNKLKREDLLTEDELNQLLDACGDNLRDKAYIATHAESGDRAGESLSPRISDVTFLKNGGAILHVRGKTGERDISLVKSVPRLAEWISVHPAKDNKNSPLYVDRHDSFLTYSGARSMLKRRIKIAIKNAENVGKKSTLTEKRVFLTLFRHTEITNNATWMTSQLSKKRHGWTPGSDMLSNYEHLTDEDAHNATFEHYGIQSEGKQREEEQIPKMCNICQKLNAPENTICGQCGNPLTLKTAIEMQEAEQNKNQEILERLKKLEEEQKGTQIRSQSAPTMTLTPEQLRDIIKEELRKQEKSS